MNRQTKERIARKLFSKTKMTADQYRQFCLLAEELDLTVADTEKWEDLSKELDRSFKPGYINE